MEAAWTGGLAACGFRSISFHLEREGSKLLAEYDLLGHVALFGVRERTRESVWRANG